MKSILNPAFRYNNAASTNIAKTFARVRREQEAQKKRDAEREAETANKVSNIVLARR